MNRPTLMRVDLGLGVNVALDLGCVHVAGVLGVGGDAMVLLDEGVEHISENLDRRVLIL